MELVIYSGIGELPSIDYDCLRVTAFARFNSIPVRIVFDGSPFSSPSGFLPLLRAEGHLVAGYEEIIDFFRAQGLCKESDENEFRSTSYISYLSTQLEPFRQYVLWGEPHNVDSVRTLYAKRIPFPFNFTHPQKYMKLAEDFLSVHANFHINDKLENHNRSELVINAKKFVNMLAEKMSDNEWFFGKSPSEFDASVYASLAILFHMTLQNNDLKSHINECPNLVKYMKRVRSKYLFDVKVNEPEQKPIVTKVKHVFINKETGSISNGTMKVIAALLALGTMTLFAVTHGILEIGKDDGSIEDFDYSAYDDDDDGLAD